MKPQRVRGFRVGWKWHRSSLPEYSYCSPKDAQEHLHSCLVLFVSHQKCQQNIIVLLCTRILGGSLLWSICLPDPHTGHPSFKAHSSPLSWALTHSPQALFIGIPCLVQSRARCLHLTSVNVKAATFIVLVPTPDHTVFPKYDVDSATVPRSN